MDLNLVVIFGSIVLITFISVTGSIIHSWIKKGSSKNLSENKEFLNALREFKENMERRVANLEAIVADEKSPQPPVKSGKEKKSVQNAIELELDDEKSREEESGEPSPKLRNMLNQ